MCMRSGNFLSCINLLVGGNFCILSSILLPTFDLVGVHAEVPSGRQKLRKRCLLQDVGM